MWAYVRPAIFIAATLALAYLSRNSLRRPRSHGFYRFFVFEFILALILANLLAWYRDPFSWNQIVSWSLLILSFAPLVLGVRALHVQGGSGTLRRQEPELHGFERTTKLVREGIFRYIRHPMYCSLLLLAWGVFFKAPSLVGGGLSILTTAGLIIMAIIEEDENLRTFGQDYREYMLHTKRFIPYVF